MLLLHQTGSVRVGEVVRYTLTYTPSLDRILPPPTHLHVKVRNTSAIPLRAAYLHGPYTLYAACYPSTFDPYKNQEHSKDGEPDYEPQLKAGGQWTAKLVVPEYIRTGTPDDLRSEQGEKKGFTWIIEVASQVLFSTSASVHYEVLVGRDEKSVSLGFNGVVSGHGVPGKLEEHQNSRQGNSLQMRGVFSKAISLKVDDTADLWSRPAFPDTWPDGSKVDLKAEPKNKDEEASTKKKRKKIHLVIITHGLHSNTGADMLFMKERIDATAQKAAEDAKKKKIELREKKAMEQNDFGREAVEQRTKSAPEITVPDQHNEADEDDDDEQVLVRGFAGNAVKTERGIQYLGKRLAKYVLSVTYPDQPYLPVKSSISQSITRTFTGGLKPTQTDGKHPSHKHSSIAKDEKSLNYNLPYRITSISFVGHSLGGLVQTYAIAYIQKHSPEFFERINPINFVAMATPFLGLSNENPIYVRFALDFGLVGRTGQDLGLTWRAPTIARNGWGAMVGGFSTEGTKDKEVDPGAKPLLRILPTGPAHIALKRFRNRSVYSNVVNDGIVPLRTSCLLFLDWRGLERVEKARRENGLVGTVVNWGLAEITGQNASAPRKGFFDELFADSGDDSRPSGKKSPDPGSKVPQAEAGQGLDQIAYVPSTEATEPEAHQKLNQQKSEDDEESTNFWASLTSFFRPHAGSKKSPTSPKKQIIYKRGQTMKHDQGDDYVGGEHSQHLDEHESMNDHRKMLVRGSSLYTNNSAEENLDAPPRTTVLESAGDLINPPLPPKEFLLDPASRPRTIFHDRVYHPEDIPPPPTKRQKTFMRRTHSRDGTVPNQAHSDLHQISSSTSEEAGGMKIEEKIARAYHKDMSWRKVLVRLEPDAHNNMIVRRMFANAYGWPVVQHMCDTHFAYTTAARTKDEDQRSTERALSRDRNLGKHGEQVKDQVKPPDESQLDQSPRTPDISRSKSSEDVRNEDPADIDEIHKRQKKLHASAALAKGTRSGRTPSELRESRDEISDLVSMVSARGEPSSNYSTMHSGTAALHRLARQDSGRWSDRFFEGSEDEDEDDQLAGELLLAKDRGKFLGINASPRSTRSGASAASTFSDDGKLRPTNVVGKEILPSGNLVKEPDEMSRRTSRESNVSDAQDLSLTSLGLGKSLSEMVAEGVDKQRRRSSIDRGIAEQVALARTEASQQKKEDEPAASSN